MGVNQIFALLAALLPGRVFGANGATPDLPLRRRPAAAFASAAALVAFFIGYVVLFDRAVVEVAPAAVAAGLPLRFLNAVTRENATVARADQLLYLALAVAVAFGVFLFHLGALGAPARRMAAGCVAAALAAATLATPATDSGDPYFYVGLATLGAHAYSPPAVPFAGDLHAIDAIWGTPMYASPYGPVWIALTALLLGPLGTLGAKLFALKLLGLVSVLACAELARRLGAARTVVAGILCNPALYLAFVAGAHNDLFATDLILAGVLAARRSVVVAFVLALAAVLVKVTLAPIAVLAVLALPSLRVRLAFAALLALATAGVYALAGGVMVHALIATIRAFAHPMSRADLVFRGVLAAIALGGSAWALGIGRVRAQSAWAPPALGGFALPSYAVWGLPIALTSTPVALAYLVSLPLLSFFQCPALPVTPSLDLAGNALVIVSIAVAAVRLRPGSGSGLVAGRSIG